MNFRAVIAPFCLAAWIATAISAVHAAELVAHWGFGTEETARLVAHGGVHRDVPGPRPPQFPDFEAENTAVKFDGSGAHFSLADTGAGSPFQFTNGDAITLEAWVNMAESFNGENLYIVGKGRTGDPAFSKDNQNWALRVQGSDGQSRVSFLFATPHAAQQGGGKDAHWHRWTSSAGFAPESGWHRVAVSYKFGEPESIRAWIDSDPAGGEWEMGGPTRDAPVVDDDAIWIGSSLGGATANSFRGALDEISIYRGILADDAMRSRFRRANATPEPSPAKETVAPNAKIPEGRVLVTFNEGLAAHDSWPAAGTVPPETTRWATGNFVIPRLPLRYDNWGIRQSWKGPVLVRAEADVQLPPGKVRFLMRARGLGRLWVNGAVIAHTKPPSGSTDGYQPVPRVPDPPAPGLHITGYGDQEVFGEAEIGATGRCRVVLEALVGGKKFRAESGEMCVAAQTADGKSFALLNPQNGGDLAPQSMTDAVWDAAAARAEASLTELDDLTRRTAAVSQDAYWEKRHAFGRQWAAQHPAPAIPPMKNTTHPIDAFLTAKIERALAAAAAVNPEESKHFYGEVLPILSENCFRCHGEKEKSGLRLNSRESALKPAKSGSPAIVPGKPAESELLSRVASPNDEERMPPTGERLKPAQVATLKEWIKSGASWPAPLVDPAEVAAPPQADDAAFLRRVYLDLVGVPPSDHEARTFLADTAADKRARVIDGLLGDARFADSWMGYWQDVLAENPNIVKPSLNNSGPFRWFIYEALRDGKPFDRLVTELILQRGSVREGGSAGFGMAADNDAPFAAKGQIVGSAFLGIELQCARCHDSPFHSTKQRELYSLAAMLSRKAVTVPPTSTVPAAFFEKKARESLIKVTLKPGESIAPVWPFAAVCGVAEGAELTALTQTPDDTREKLAALVTAPQNRRFAQVLVNRIWKRLIGAGIVEPVHDWEGHAPSHPELLEWLARAFVAHNYDFKHIVRLIATSQIYQREAAGRNLKLAPEKRFFAAPERRRLTAEQVVDSLFSAAGKSMVVEELTFDPDSRRPADEMINLGRPHRAWMFASLSNERDRPSLALPRIQAVTDVLEAFGWSGSRQSPRSERETDPNVLQPGVLQNSVMSSWIVRASAGSDWAELAVHAPSPEALVDSVYIRFLGRPPLADESKRFSEVLAPGFSGRLLPASAIKPVQALPPLPKITWSSHLVPEATRVKFEMERRSRAGDPPDPRLDSSWRETYEDVIWSVINNPEFVWIP